MRPSPRWGSSCAVCPFVSPADVPLAATGGQVQVPARQQSTARALRGRGGAARAVCRLCQFQREAGELPGRPSGHPAPQPPGAVPHAALWQPHATAVPSGRGAPLCAGAGLPVRVRAQLREQGIHGRGQPGGIPQARGASRILSVTFGTAAIRGILGRGSTEVKHSRPRPVGSVQ